MGLIQIRNTNYQVFSVTLTELHQNSIEITNINDLEKESSKLENEILKALEKATKTNEFFSKPKFTTNV